MLESLRHVPDQEHLCLLYENQEEQAAAFVPFLQAGLVQNELCIYLPDDSDPNWVIDELSRGDFPIMDYLKRGAFQIISTHDAYLRDGVFDLDRIMEFWDVTVKGALDQGYRAVRASGEMTWALSNFPGCDKLLQYESRINSVMPTSHLTGLCQYNRKRFDANFIRKIIHLHPFVCVSNQLVQNPAFINPEAFNESNTNIEVQALVDNLLMTKTLVEANQRLQQALEEKERIQSILQQQKSECEDLYNELISLARVVSHELQSPLTIMESYLRLLSVRYKDRLGADADEFIGKSIAASRLVSRMIDDLWNYARIDSQGESHIEDLDILHILLDVLHQLEPEITLKKAIINHDSTFPRIKAARSHIVFLFKALIQNAVRFGRPYTQPEIYVGAEKQKDGILFRVEDNGIGIDSIYTNDVFRLFHRVIGNPNENGTGMGLPISKRIMQFYEGKIWFECSTNEQGESKTTFYFFLPQQRQQDNVTQLRDYQKKTAVSRTEAKSDSPEPILQ